MPDMQNAHKIAHKYRGDQKYFTDSSYTYFPVVAANAGDQISMGIWIDPATPTVGHLVGWFKPTTYTSTPRTVGTIAAPSGVSFSADRIITDENYCYINITGTTVAVHAGGSYDTNEFSVWPGVTGTEVTVSVTGL